jgi:hypothetical protein
MFRVEHDEHMKLWRCSRAKTSPLRTALDAPWPAQELG